MRKGREFRKSRSVPGLRWARLLFNFFWISKTHQKNLKKNMRKHIHVFNTCVNFRHKISNFAPCVKKTNLSFLNSGLFTILSVRFLSFLHRPQKLIFPVQILHDCWVLEYVHAQFFAEFFEAFSYLKKIGTVNRAQMSPGTKTALSTLSPYIYVGLINGGWCWLTAVCLRFLHRFLYEIH